MEVSTLGFPVLHHLSEFAQTHVHWVSDTIQPSHPLTSPSSPAFNFFTASGSFPMNQLLISGGQNIGTSASASVFPMNIQGWFPLGLTGWISLQSKVLSRVFSNTTVQKHQFFGAQLSLQSNCVSANPILLIYPFPFPSPFGNHKFVFSICGSVSVL